MDSKINKIPNHDSKWLYLPVEIQYRALDAKLLLACFAAMKGYQIIVGSKNQLNKLLPQLPPGVYFDKCVSRPKATMLKNISNMGHKIVAIDEEGFTENGRNQYLTTRHSNENFSIISLFFTWGELEKDALYEYYPRWRDKVKIVGNPRVDIWGSNFINIYKEEIDVLKKHFGNFIFLPSNFGLAADPERVGRYIDWLYSRGDIKNDKNRLSFYNKLSHKTQALEDYLQLLHKLSDHFPHFNIIVRPHSGDSIEFWKKRTAQLPNVTVESDGPVTPYICASLCMIHHGCTTGFESYLTGTPSIAYLPNFNENLDNNPTVSLSTKAYDIMSVIELINQAKSNNFSFPENSRSYAEKYLANLNSTYACETIIEYLDKLDVKTSHFPENILNNSKKEGPGKDQKKALLNGLSFKKLSTLFKKKDVIINSKPKAFVAKHKWPGCDVDTVKKRINAFCSIETKIKNIQVMELDKNLYFINSNHC